MINQQRTWHGLDGTRASYGFPDDEGWYFDADAGGISHNGNDPQRFKTQEEALEFVRRKADGGSAFHQRAVLAHIKARLMQ